MNKEVLDQITHFNQYKGLGYFWDSRGKTYGTLGDVTYGNTVFKGAEDKRTYCCGITLQVLLEACKKKGIDLKSIYPIYRDWFIINIKKDLPIWENKGPVDALVKRGFATEVKLSELEQGDFGQIWRKNGSGHSIIGIQYFTDKGIPALKYWSSQPSTNGIGYKTEYFDGVKNPITHAWFCRLK